MIDGKIAQANGRLSLGKVGVTIERMGDRLYLRATFPAKPGAARSDPHQQRLVLGIHANPAGLSFAEKQARKVGAALDCNEFKWVDYGVSSELEAKRLTVSDWLAKFEDYHRGNVEDTTWTTEYQRVFSRVAAAGELLTVELLERVILQTAADSRQRRRFCVTLGRLAEFAGLNADFKRLRGRYAASQIEPRDLPSDDAILAQWERIKHPGWRWVYGMMAAYGLRNHEAFSLDTSQLEAGGHQVRVLDGKTGARNVWPFEPDWVEHLELRSVVLPEVSGRHHADYGNRVSQYFTRSLKLPFKPYDLRHCWAVRTLLLGLDTTLAAQQMGHSLKVHNETYHRWISDEIHHAAFTQIQQRPGRSVSSGQVADLGLALETPESY